MRIQFSYSIALMMFLAIGIPSFPDEGTDEKQNASSTHPDIQGIWFFGTGTPLTRPPELGDQLHYSEEEATAQQEKLLQAQQKSVAIIDPTLGAPDTGGTIGFQADFNFALARTDLTVIDGKTRTSLVIDPANGQFPIRKDYQDYWARIKNEYGATNIYDNPETMGLGERCIPGGPLPNLYPLPWNANLQIIQAGNFIVIAAESSAPPRIIRLNGQHLNNGLRHWLGDSIAWWEDQTLVIHTKDFKLEQTRFPFPMSEEFELTERITPINKNKMLYTYTGNDLKAYTASFTVETLLKRRPPHERMFEVACHEGNYSMKNLLAGARYEDKHPPKKPKNPELPAHVIKTLVGVWHGEVNNTQLIFRFEALDPNTVSALLDIPSYGLTEVQLNKLSVVGGKIKFDVADVGANFIGTLTNGKISGDWSREDKKSPLVLTHETQ